jgi:hypothetical protein
MNIFRVARKSTITIAGSTAEGMRGGIYSNQRHGGDDDLLENPMAFIISARRIDC